MLRRQCFALLMALVLGWAARPYALAEDFFVATDGNDAWSGRLAAPNADRTDGPFATVAQAQRAVRERKKQHPEAAVTVAIRGGFYPLSETLAFGPEDSGSENAPVVYQAYAEERPILSGGRLITGWQVDAQGRWHVVLGEVKNGSWNFAQLFVNGQRRYRPRWPKQGFHQVAEQLPPSTEEAGRGHDRFRFAGQELNPGWHNLDDVEVIVFHQWSASRLRIASIDPADHTVLFRWGTGFNTYWASMPTGHRWFAVNVKEALAPGEFYLDRKSGELIYHPKPGETPEQSEVVAPRLETLVALAGRGDTRQWTQHLHFRGLIFAHTNWTCPDKGQAFPQADIGLNAAVNGLAARNITFEGCGVIHTGGYAFAFGEGCRENRVENCEMLDLGGGGVKIGHAEKGSWSDASRVPAGEDALVSHITVRNCTIAHGGRLHPASVGVWIGHSPFNVVEHNDIYDLYYTGVSVGWSWGYAESKAHHNRVDYNHIYNIGQYVLSDMGGVYTLGVSPGTTVNRNKIHDVYAFSYGGWGLYTDEGSTNIEMAYNLVYNTKTGSFHQHYGRENRVHNNILVNSVEHQIQRTRTEEHISFFFERNVVFWENDSPLLGSNWKDNNFRMDYNLYWHAGKPVVFPGNLTLEQWREQRQQDVHTVIADPKFRDPAAGDWRLQADSPAFTLGFKDFDPNEAGRTTAARLTSDLPPVPAGIHKGE